MAKSDEIHIPASVAEKMLEDAKKQQAALQPIKDELDKLPPNHSKDEAFGAFLKGLQTMINKGTAK